MFTTLVVFDSNFNVFPERGEATRVEKHVAKRASKERTASEGHINLKSTGTQMEPPHSPNRWTWTESESENQNDHPFAWIPRQNVTS